MPALEVRTIDLVVLLVYVIGTRILFGWYFARKTRGGGSEEYFLAGRSLRWPIIGLSFYVSNMSGSTFVGLPGSGYHDGIAVFHYEWLPALILIGGSVIAVLTWLRVPSWDAVREAAPERALHLIQPASDPVLPWPGVFTGILLIGIYFWCTNQFVIQRALGARDLDQGRWGALFAGVLKLPNLFILILPGVMATSLYPDLERPDFVFPALAFDVLPIGVRGLILAALAAAILSSLEAILNSASTLFTVDFVKTLRPRTRDRTLVWIGRWATVVLMTVAVLWTPVILSFPTLWQYLQSILAYVTPPIVAVFLAGIFWPRANAFGAVATIVVGVPLGAIAWSAVEILGLVSLQFLYASGLVFVLSLGVLAASALWAEAPEPEKVAAHTWRPRLGRSPTDDRWVIAGRRRPGDRWDRLRDPAILRRCPRQEGTP